VVMRSRRLPRRPFYADSPRARGPVLALSPAPSLPSTLHHVAPSWGLHPISGSPAPRRRAPPDPRAGPGLSLHQRRARCRAGIKVAAPAAHSLCPISFSFLPVLTTGGRDKGGGGAPLGVPRECTHGSSCCCCFSFFFPIRDRFASPCHSSPLHRRHPEGRGCRSGCSDDVRDQATLPVSSPFQAVAPLAAGLR